MVVAPHFDARRFPPGSYHRGNLMGRRLQPRPRSEWTTRYVPRIIEWGRAACEDPGLPVYLAGFSAGAQYLSRVAAFETLPGVVSIVIASPSSHVLPVLDARPGGERVPYGMSGLLDDGPAPQEMLRNYLHRPITLYVGSNDNDPGAPRLNRSPAAQRQGHNRLERAIFTYQTARISAERYGMSCNWRLLVEPGIGHDATHLLLPCRFSDIFSVGAAADN